MSKNVFIKLSLKEEQYKALETYASLLGTTKAGGVMHMIDICSLLGKYYTELLPMIEKAELQSNYEESVSEAFNKSDNKMIASYMQWMKLKSELVKLGILYFEWEKENKTDWDFMKYNSPVEK
jgi:hypothetical protein